MRKAGLLAIATFLLTTHDAAAISENDRLSSVKEVPNPYSLAMRQNYVLMCTNKIAGLTVKRISANEGACACRAIGSTGRMKPKARFMSVCEMGGKPCDFTEVEFDTDEGEIVFTWDPVEVWDPKEFNLEFR